MSVKRIGVFICHCGLNIARTVDVQKATEEIAKYPGVVHAENYRFMCSDPGQDLVRKAIVEKQLDGLVMANCSPTLHEKTFRRLAAGLGLNPYQVEVANIRELCSWPHGHDGDVVTQKAIRIIQATVDRLRNNQPLFPIKVSFTRRALVIGGGIAGIEAALDIANGGYEVVLVEKTPSIGGHMAQLSQTFPKFDYPLGMMSPKMVELIQHPNIKLYTYSEVEEISGYVGNFVAKIRQKAAYLDREKCNGCGLCWEKCPAEAPSEFERGLANRKAIYIPNPQAMPHRPVIDAKACLRQNGGDCNICAEVCPEKVIDFTQAETVIEEKVGAIVVATGYEVFPTAKVVEYPEDPDILDGLQFERLLSLWGPTGGQIKRPSDGKVPQEVVFIQCIGSRDPAHYFPYCSRVCCMYTAKQASLYRQRVPQGQPYIFFMDVRSTAKGCEEFVKKVMEDQRILYIRGRVSKIFRRGDKLVVWGGDTLTGKQLELEADLVVLATAMVPSPDASEVAKKLKIAVDQFGFVSEAHPKLRPVESLTAGIYLAGTAQAPKDIADTVNQASGAASKVLAFLSKEELLHEPTVSYVDEEVCSGCGYCVANCAYEAISLDPKKRVARVNEVLCEGCGACAATCPSGAIQLRNFSAKQLLDMIDVATEEYAFAGAASE